MGSCKSTLQACVSYAERICIEGSLLKSADMLTCITASGVLFTIAEHSCSNSDRLANTWPVRLPCSLLLPC